MEVGVIEKLDEEEEKSPVRNEAGSRRGRSSGGDGSDDGGGGGGGDNGGPDKKKPREQENERIGPVPEKSRILMWFLLLAVLMTFGGLISAYVVISTNAALEWRPFSLPFQVWVSTAIILFSSLTYNFGKTSLQKGRFNTSKNWFLVTTVLGGMFVSSQILSWMALVGRGLYMTGNPYAGFFYILTAVHAIHVLGGIAALGYILLRTWRPPVSQEVFDKNAGDAVVIGWYWHTMDALWLVLLFLLGFWK